MTPPTEDEVRMALMVLGNALGSEAQHLSIASAIATIETALDEARKDRERLAHLRRLFVESAERLTDEDTVLRCSVSVVGRVSNVELNYFGGTREELLASKFDALVDDAIDQARGA